MSDASSWRRRSGPRRRRSSARCGRAASTTSSGRSGSRSSSRSRSTRRRRAARRSTTCCSSGPPGLGKTTLAHIVREELGVGIRTVAGPALERRATSPRSSPRSSRATSSSSTRSTALNRAVEEILYPALEDFRLDIVVGQGAGARTLTLDLPPFTLVGATTRTGLLTTPLRDRFGMTFRLGYYDAGRARVDRPPLGRDPRRRDRRRRGRGDRARARAGRRASRTASCGGCATSPRCGTRGRSPLDVAQEALELLEVDERGARAHRPRAPRGDRAEVRRRPGRALDARRLARRGAGHDRGRLRALPAAARLPAADAARARHHGARPRALGATRDESSLF